MSESDSELSETTPKDTTIEHEIRQIIKNIYASGDLDTLTVRRVRAATEKSLGLEEGYLKQEQWKIRSKTLIESEALNHDDVAEASKRDETPTVEGKSITGTKVTKRASQQDPKASKRRKTEPTVNEENVVWESAAGRREKKNTIPSESDDTDDAGDSIRPDDAKGRSMKVETPEIPQSLAAGEDESELSSVIDEEPKPKRKKKSTDADPKGKTTGRKGRSKEDKSPDMDPNEEEVKRLKGWLVKCGIRKMWFRELKDCATSQAQIRHLKNLLAEAGMTGRYSTEKANQIRETRELQADLEAVQAGAKQWGKDAEDEARATRPRRRVAPGLEGLDFLDDDDGDESD